ncbi:hypothetical protein [Dyella sp.]|jgi:hypothetical protein|uniref:hypothetical protein n=1 Tax=Dyella sp. TaxID=1869338 RepID=UPI002D7884DF|nr:hypothetical protein [Dyella sp.]HET6432788.1 hypothetical protein [Dyella sp.]
MKADELYEPDHVDGRRLAQLGAIFVLALAAILTVVWMLWAPPRRETGEPGSVPPPPRLAPDLRIDLLAMREAQQERLQRYGWSDPAHRYAQVPIRRAMAIMANAAPAQPPEARP